MATNDPARHLGHGQFFGLRQQTWDVRGLAIASMRADPTFEVQTHTHDTAHFIVLTSGQYITSARRAGSLCVQPRLIYNPPGTTHRDTFRRIAGRVDGSFISIALSRDRLEEISRALALVEEPTCFDQPDTVRLALRLARETQRWTTGSELVAEAICLELATKVTISGTAASGGARPDWLRVARDLLRAHCVEGVSIGEIAHACDVHPVHLARVFRKYFGCSPGVYLRKCRVELAAAMLRDTRTSLSILALQCGYTDQSHFSNAFRQAYHATPTEYRRITGR